MARQSQPQNSVAARKDLLDFHEGLKQSLVARDRQIPDLAHAAPAALNLMGQLRLLAFSEAGKHVQLGPTGGHSSFFTDRYLAVCLTELFHQGNEAFDTAHMGMETLHMVAETHFGRDGSVVKASSSAECTLTSQMHHIANMLFDIQNSDPEVLKQDCKSLENAMHECQNVANNVCKEFSKWKQMAREIETRATAKYGRAQTTTYEVERELETVAAQSQSNTRQREFIAEQLQRADEELDKATEQYNKAIKSDSPWKDIWLGIVSETANLPFRLIHGAVEVATEVARGYSGGSRPSDNTTPMVPQTDDVSTSSVDAQANLNTTYAPRINSLVAELKALLAGKQLHEICAAASGDANPLENILGNMKQLRIHMSSSGRGSCDQAISILNGCIQIGDEISRQKDISQTSGLQHGTRDSDVVAGWNTTVGGLADSAFALSVVAESQPGQAFGNDVPLIKSLRAVVSNPTANFDSRSLLRRKREKLILTQATKENYQSHRDQISQNLLQQENERLKLSSRMRALSTRTATLQQVSEVLLEAIEHVSKLQAQTRALARYFQTIENFLNHVGKQQLARLLTTSSRISASGMESITPSTIQAQKIYNILVPLRTYFATVSHNADFYLQISNEYLMPLTAEISNLPISASRTQQDKASQALLENTNTATRAVHEREKQRMQGFEGFLTQNITEIDRQIQGIPGMRDAQATKETERLKQIAKAAMRQTRTIVASDDDQYVPI